MNQRYLVVYGHTSDATDATSTWGGTSPDIPGCASVGETLEEMRAMMKEAIEGHLQRMADDGDLLPDPTTTVVDFADDTPENGTEYSVVEWLEVSMPATATLPAQQVALAIPPPTALTASTHH